MIENSIDRHTSQEQIERCPHCNLPLAMCDCHKLDADNVDVAELMQEIVKLRMTNQMYREQNARLIHVLELMCDHVSTPGGVIHITGDVLNPKRV